MPSETDVIIVGSGPAAVSAAEALLAKGLHVSMIDGGFSAPSILEEPLPADFVGIRKERPDQYRWFLGEALSGIPIRELEAGFGGGIANGNRSYVTAGTEQIPLQQHNVQIIQSLARGGLGAIWGATCAYLDDDAIRSLGIPTDGMREAYIHVTTSIGISGPQNFPGIQPPLTPDHHTEAMLKKADRKKWKLDALGIRVTQTHSAVLTQEKNGRRPLSYNDMEYYSDANRSVWRPQFTLEALQRNPSFQYIPGYVVEYIEESAESATVYAKRVEHAGLSIERFTAKKVVMAAGTVGSARILLRSFGLYDTPVPLMAKPHTFTACLHTSSLGKAGPRERSSLCQLLVTDQTKNERGFHEGVAQLYSYRSLLLFRLLQNIPLPTPDAFRALALLAPSLIVADIRFPTMPQPGNTLQLSRDEKHTVRALQSESDAVHLHHQAALKRLHKGLQTIGLWPAKTLELPHGSSSHYAGTIPFDGSGRFPLSVDPNGKLHQGKHIFVADASTFKALPAEPHTLTLMANAWRIGNEIARSFR